MNEKQIRFTLCADLRKLINDSDAESIDVNELVSTLERLAIEARYLLNKAV